MEATPPLNRDSPAAPRLRGPVSWVIYDLANTIYSAIVVTFLINPYVEGILRAASYAAAANFVSMVLAGLVAPACGEVTDRAGTSKRWLMVTTVVSCLACGLMALLHFTAPPGVAVWLILVAFGVANFCYQLSLVFYNSLLPGLAPPDRVGLWSGIGVGVGYFGMTVSMGVLGLVFAVTGGEVEDQIAAGFAAAGVLFLLLSLPLFAWVSERPPLRTAAAPTGRLTGAMRASLRIWARNLKEPVPRRFLLGNLFLTDVLNTTIFVFSLYCVKVFDDVADVTSGKLRLALVLLSLTAFALGILCGRLSDRFGPRRALLAAAVSLGAALAGGVLLPASAFFWMVALVSTFGAFGLAGIWTAGRALLVRIAPPERIGEYFGMYGLSLKVSVMGAIVFGLLADHLPFADEALRYRCALASGFVPLALGLWLIGRLRA